jgi:hypothetical protein
MNATFFSKLKENQRALLIANGLITWTGAPMRATTGLVQKVDAMMPV